VGNPHCVVHVDDATPELAHRLGPLIENHEMFPNRTNVQFVKVLGRNAFASRFGSEAPGTPWLQEAAVVPRPRLLSGLDCAMAT